MNTNIITPEIISILHAIKGADPALHITHSTSLMTELNFESLEILELVNMVRRQYGVDLLKSPHTIKDLQSAETIVAAVVRANGQACAGNVLNEQKLV